ncbi:MAG: sigma-70 family RNA polymerase sigma factor [Planctomycetota bacterium]
MSSLGVDEKLLDQVMAGDQEAFRSLVGRCDRLVTALLVDRVGNREEIADLRQEVFFRVYRGLERLRDQKKFTSWLRGICRNVVREFWAARARGHASLDDSVDPEAPEQIDEEVDSIEFAIGRALDVLPVRYREVLRLRYFAKLSYEEIAETLGLSFMAVDALMRRAKGRLREVVTPILERENLK